MDVVIVLTLWKIALSQPGVLFKLYLNTAECEGV